MHTYPEDALFSFLQEEYEFQHMEGGFITIAQTYIRHPDAELKNLSIDQKNRQLRERHHRSAYGGNYKSLYAWQGDSLVMIGSDTGQHKTGFQCLADLRGSRGQ